MSSSGTESDSSASSDVDFNDYGLEPEYTEEERRQMEEAATALHLFIPLMIMISSEFCLNEYQWISNLCRSDVGCSLFPDVEHSLPLPFV